MMFVRRRYLYWLIKAYFKRWKRTIGLSLIFGSISFFVILLFFTFYLQPLLNRKIIKIGLSGNYKLDSIPDEILGQTTFGLTTIDDNGTIKPAAAASWEILDGGQKYVFHIKNDIYFHNGNPLTSKNIPYNFKDVKMTTPDPQTVVFELKSPYSPFLTTVAKPILIERTIGLGKFLIKDYELNGDYIKTLTIQNIENKDDRKTYYFYPTDEALKTAFMLGEVTVALDIQNIIRKDIDLLKWKNVRVKRRVDHSKLVTLFYNNKDKYLSNKKIRQALNYSLSENFPAGTRALSPLPPVSIYYATTPNMGIYDVELAKSYLSSSGEDPSKMKVKISTTQDFLKDAKQIQSNWRNIGVLSDIEIVNDLPSDFQVFIYDFKVSKDPDQYTLWHSNQINNLIDYKNPRIDKLLENGRVTVNTEDRIKIYADFQKYLLDDAPASFLYFPYEYTLEKI